MYNNRLGDMINDERIRQELRKAPAGQLAHEFEAQNAKSHPAVRQHPRAVAVVIIVMVVILALLTPWISLAQEEQPSFQTGGPSMGENQRDVWYGILLLRLGQYASAVEMFTEVLENDAGHPSALVGRAIAYYYLADYDNAIIDSLAASELAPDYTTPYWTLGNVYFDQHDCASALAAFQHYLERTTDYADPAVNEQVTICQSRLAEVGS